MFLCCVEVQCATHAILCVAPAGSSLHTNQIVPAMLSLVNTASAFARSHSHQGHQGVLYHATTLSPYTHARTRATTCALVQSHQRCLVHFGLRGVLGPFHHLTHMLCFFLIFCICNSSCLHLFFICNHTARASRYNVKYGEHDGILMAIDGRNKRTFESDVISSRTPGRKFYERIILHEQDVMCV